MTHFFSTILITIVCWNFAHGQVRYLKPIYIEDFLKNKTCIANCEVKNCLHICNYSMFTCNTLQKESFAY